MKEILGQAKNVRGLLGGAKYSIDFYQREYRWERKQVQDLINDLAERFLEDFDENHDRGKVQGYGHYFLGSIIISEKDGKKFIVDGQQRLTSLTLLLIYLESLQKEAPEGERVPIRDLIFSTKYGHKSFNIDVDERAACMEALYEDKPFDETGKPESVQRIYARYQDIQGLFPEEIRDRGLFHFIDWLIENVHLVEITASSDDDAYIIFETMNDRGLSLTPTEMLKGFLLANIADTPKRNAMSTIWKQWVAKLEEIERDTAADFLKAWLRSQYAQSIRERKKGAKPRDFARIGTEFHRWVRDNRNAIGLDGGPSYVKFIERHFDFYARQYVRLMEASTERVPDLERILYLAQHGFTSQYHVLLAPLTPRDSEAVVLRKLRMTSVFLDIWVHRRIWNFKSITYSTVQYAMFLVMREIRGKTPTQLRKALADRLENDDLAFADEPPVHLNQWNRGYFHRILARMTDYIETGSEMASHYMEYTTGRGRNRYEIEHIWANKPDRHASEFSHPSEFSEYRNRIGGLLLLPKAFNQSYGDSAYKTKRKHYDSQNLLARSLHANCYDHNPKFKRFIKETGLPFKPCETFTRADLDGRQKLYRQIAERIWDPALLAEE